MRFERLRNALTATNIHHRRCLVPLSVVPQKFYDSESYDQTMVRQDLDLFLIYRSRGIRDLTFSFVMLLYSMASAFDWPLLNSSVKSERGIGSGQT